jgi:hypothetical protein
VSSNGASVGAASVNGSSANGASANGASMNGASANGASVNGAAGPPSPVTYGRHGTEEINDHPSDRPGKHES